MSNQQQYPNHPPFEGGPQYPQTNPLILDQDGLLLGAPPTAWQSIPSPVRFAVWVWAIGIIVSLAGAALFAVLMVLGVAAGMGSL